LWVYAKKMRYSSFYHDCMLTGEQTYLSDSFSEFVLNRIPDCEIEYEHVASDEDFKSYDDTYFEANIPDFQPKAGKIPKCNADDILVLFSFLKIYGSHYIYEADTGGKIKTTYDVSTKLISDELTPYLFATKIKQRITSQEFETPLQDLPTRVIKFGDENSHRSGIAYHEPSPDKMSELKQMLQEGDPEIFEAAEKILATDHNDGYKPIMHIASEVTGGVRTMPLIAGGRFSPSDKESWLSTLRVRPGLNKKKTSPIENLLRHDTMIRSLMMYCGPKPFGPYGETLPDSWDPLTGDPRPGKKWQSATGVDPPSGPEDQWNFVEALAADLAASSYSHVFKWKDLKDYECPKVLRRKYNLIMNFRRFVEVKAEGLLDLASDAEEATSEAQSQLLRMRRSFLDWVDMVQELAKKTSKEAVVSTKRLWKHISDLKESEKQDSIANKIVQPLMYYLYARARHHKMCVVACDKTLEVTKRKNFLRSVVKPTSENVHAPLCIIKQEKKSGFDRDFIPSIETSFGKWTTDLLKKGKGDSKPRETSPKDKAGKSRRRRKTP